MQGQAFKKFLYSRNSDTIWELVHTVLVIIADSLYHKDPMCKGGNSQSLTNYRSCSLVATPKPWKLTCSLPAMQFSEEVHKGHATS